VTGPLNSTDLAYSIIAANATGRFSPYLTQVKTLNATAVSMTEPASQPNLVAIAMGEIFIIPQHVYSKATTLSQMKGYKGFDAATVCGGSYCLAQAYVQGTNPIILVPNQYYYLGNQQYYAEVHVHIFASYDAAAAALFSGQVQAMGMPGLQYTAAAAVAFQKPGFQIRSFDAPNLFQIIHINFLKSPFDNVDFRQGLAYATDRNLISQAIFGAGYTNIPYGLVIPAPAGENEYPYNLSLAEASFVKAGLQYKGTTLQYSNGTQVNFGISYPSGEPDSQSVATLLQLQWKKVGIAATPTLVEDTTLFADYGSGNWGVSTILENGADWSTCCHFIDQMQSSGGYTVSNLATNHPAQPSDYVTAQIGSLLQQWSGVPLGTPQSDSLSAQIAKLMDDQVVAIPLWASRGGYVLSTSIYWGNNNPANPLQNTGAYDLQDEVQLQQYHSTWYYAHPAIAPATTTSTAPAPSTSSTTSQTGGGGAGVDYTPYIYGGVALVVIIIVAVALLRRGPSKPAT
jgi:ABC-type transport system substrate-binding protein